MRTAYLVLCRKGIDYASASNRYYRRVEPDYEPVASPYSRGLLEPQLSVGRLSRRQSVPVQKYHLAEHFVRTAIEVHPAVVQDYSVRGTENTYLCVQHIGNGNRIRTSQDIAPVYVFLGDA